MQEFLMKSKIDFAFKEIMTDEKARTGFLAAVLKINPEDWFLSAANFQLTSLFKFYANTHPFLLQLCHLLWLADFLLPKCCHTFIIALPTASA